ncbi:MAG: transposase, partial [bacterium]|nr:transposase [bacterium]
EQFVQFHGKGIIKKLILDRGFLDGPNIGRCKQQWGIDVLIPARRDMDIYEDVLGLAKAGLLDFSPWVPPAPARPVPLHRPESVRKREESRQRTLAQRKAQANADAKASASSPKLIRSEVAVVAGVKTFTSCPVPMDAIVSKEIDADGREDYWVLLSTASVADPVLGRRDYALRTAIEERHRQLKCFSDLEAFSSRSFNLIVNQVVFVLLTYSLLQWYLLRIGRQELNPKTRPRTLELLRPTITVILIYYKACVARLSPLEHQELALTLDEKARKKILAKTRALRRSLANELYNPRPP